MTAPGQIGSGGQWPRVINAATFRLFVNIHTDPIPIFKKISFVESSVSIYFHKSCLSGPTKLRGIAMQFEVLAKCHTTRARVSKMRLARE